MAVFSLLGPIARGFSRHQEGTPPSAVSTPLEGASNGTAVLFCTAFGRIYAVLDRCPRDGGSLQGARLEAFLLVCPCHGERYDLRSGRSLTDPTLSLELLPVVVERGTVRVALPEKVSAGD
jgi:3-phenylpropionate/trans-cinnamate dioxygenase ferredoxin subunit